MITNKNKFRLLLFSFLLFPLVGISQEKLGFVNDNQVYDSNNKVLQVKIEVSEGNGLKKGDVRYLKIISEDSNFKKALFDISNKEGIPVKITVPETKIVTIPFDPKKIENNDKIFSLILQKDGPDQNFNITRSAHTVVLKERPKTKIGFETIKSSYKIDLAKNDEIEIPFVIKSSTFPIKEDDKAEVFIKVKGLDDNIEKEYSYTIIGNHFSGKVKIKPKESKESSHKKEESDKKKIINELRKKLVNRKYVELEMTLKRENSKFNNDIILDKEMSTMLVFIDESINSSTFSGNHYNFYLGANFDLDQELKANSFYSEIDVFLPDLSPKGAGKLGIRAGIYKNSSVSNLIESAGSREILEIDNALTNPDTIFYERKRVNSTPNVSTNNLGLYFQGFTTLKEKKTSNYLFRLLAGIHVEVIERTETYSFNDEDLFSLGTQSITTDALADNDTLVAQLSAGRSSSRKYYDSYYGVTFPMLFQNKSMEVFFNPFCGFGNPGDKERLKFAGSEDTLKSFGAFQFYLMERKFGVKLSGEVRKYFASGQNPVIVVNLSKSINLSGILTPNNGSLITESN